MSSVYDDLTLTMKRKTDKIKKYKRDLIILSQRTKKAYALTSVLILIFIWNIDSYIDYSTSVFNNTFTFNNYVPVISLNNFEIFIVIALIISSLYIYSLLSQRKKLNDKYEKLRIDIINSLDNEFCHHNQPCSCKDDYIKYMDKHNIDIIFK